MTPPIVPLFTRSLKGWFTAKGFWLVVAATLLPLVLTGAWVATHRANLAIEGGIQSNVTSPVEGQLVRFTATVRNVGPVAVSNFNDTLAVGSVSNGQLFAVASNVTTIDHLAPGESRQFTLDWNATAGSMYVVATADSDNVIQKVDEYDNQNATPILVGYAPLSPSTAPAAPANLTGADNASSTADLALAGIDVPPAGDNRTIVATVTDKGPNGVTNATVNLQVGEEFSGQFFATQQTSTSVDLSAGESKTINLTWNAQPGAYWVEAWVVAPNSTHDPDGANNHAVQSVVVQPKLDASASPPTPPAKLTIKQFYLQVLDLLHLHVLLPLVALFYAAGIVQDERDRKTLAYVLTRPTPRWVFPLLKFAASFIVATVAALVGIVLTYLLLFGTTPQGGDVGFLTTPLLASLLTLFAYGSLFTLLGVLVERPFLWGIAFVLGWENAAPIFVPWVANLTLSKHIGDAINGWPLDQGLQWLPTTSDSLNALWILLAAGVVVLVASAYAMKQREFEA